MSLLVAKALSVRRGGRAILDRVSAEFASGVLVAVVGPNGAGKSTLLAALAGLVKPDQGEVTLDGEPLSGIDRKALARRRAYLPQNPRAEWPISVERLVALGLTPQLPAFGGLPTSLQTAVDRALADADLEAQCDQPATTLSGGELGRAMLARALVGSPDILIADEPMAGLDPRHALDGARRLTAAARGGGLVIASVHDLTLAARHADRVLALKDGGIVADGRPAEVLTPDLLQAVFGVPARLRGEGAAAYVDFD
jgi:iron complex transport system ATP-binding protein